MEKHRVLIGYNYELDKDELLLLQKKLQQSFQQVKNDIKTFETFVLGLV
jgi:hypothetical protein